MNKIVILIQCPDRVGLVAAISQIVAANNLNITVMREFVDQELKMFFTRIECTGEAKNLPHLRKEFETRLGNHSNIRIHPEKQHKKIVIMVSKEYHCLADILVRHFFGQLMADICCVIGNHNTLESFTKHFGIPFYYISNENKSREQFESELSRTLDNYKPDYIFLAKFMRILSADFISRFTNKIANIHHSFLPAFIGAQPYRQAFDRGVKIIGATAHFVTEELDKGPIIVQEIIHINHNYNIPQMKLAGREIERSVLGKAINLLLEDKVFVVGNKTVIFE